MELKGKYTAAKIFTDNIESAAISQIYDVINHPAFDSANVRIMPDVHAGSGICIGFTSTIGKAISPSHIGVDIGCGVKGVLFNKTLNPSEYPLFEHRLKKEIPVGMVINEHTVIDEKALVKFIDNHATLAYPRITELTGIDINMPSFKITDDLDKWASKFGIRPEVFWHSIGTLGSGNHYMEFGDSDGHHMFSVHTGSRNVGLKVCNYWNRVAESDKPLKAEIKRYCDEAKKHYDGDKRDLKSFLKAKGVECKELYRKTHFKGYLTGEDMANYLMDMAICQAYAEFNRKTICETAVRIINGINSAKVVGEVESVHNYLDFADMTIRKGAISAHKGQTIIIPLNMRDGVILAEGKGNKDWNCSAPHGSGRALSRGAARKTLDAKKFAESMKEAGVYTTTANESTLDEAPEAYKPSDEIIKLIEDTCQVHYVVKPKINIKGGN